MWRRIIASSRHRRGIEASGNLGLGSSAAAAVLRLIGSEDAGVAARRVFGKRRNRRSGAESESVDVVADSTEAKTRRSIAAAEREDEDAEYA